MQLVALRRPLRHSQCTRSLSLAIGMSLSLRWCLYRWASCLNLPCTPLDPTCRRLATTCLLAVLGMLYPSWHMLPLGLIQLDIFSHWFQMYSTLAIGSATHKVSQNYAGLWMNLAGLHLCLQFGSRWAQLEEQLFLVAEDWRLGAWSAPARQLHASSMLLPSPTPSLLAIPRLNKKL